MQDPVTLAIAKFQIANADPRLSDADRASLSHEFLALRDSLPEPRWATNPGPQAVAYCSPADETFFGGAAGPGKAEALTSKVLTPKGWSLMGDLKVGQAVSDPTTGGASRIIQIYPQGVQPMYRITCDDNATCEATLDHLWAFKRPRAIKPRKKKSIQREQVREVFEACKPIKSKWNHHRIGTTADLIAHLENGERPRIPLSEPLLFDVNGRTGTGRADPYIVGVLLGDGHLPNLSICSCDDEIRYYLMCNGFAPAGQKMHTDGKPMNYTPETKKMREVYRNWVNNNGLTGCLSDTKFLPEYVFTAPFAYRVSILQGLMDTDGTVSEDGEVYYCTTSRRLADDVRNLIRSLGGKATITSKNPFYRTSENHKVYGLESYTLYINMPKDSAIFRLTRKIVRCTDSWNGGHDNMRSIESVEYIGEKEAQCIRVDSPYGLYVTDDYIVTHNSALLLGLALTAHSRSLILRREGTHLSELIDTVKKWQRDGDHWRGIGNGGRMDTYDGRVIELHGCDDDKEASKYQGRPHSFKGYDELPQIKESVYRMVNMWLRSTLPGERKRIVGAGNPPLKPEEEWVRRYWGPWLNPQNPFYPMLPGELGWYATIDGKEEMVEDGTPFKVRYRGKDEIVTPLSRTFIPALLSDNPDLDNSGYRAMLQKSLEPMRSKLLYGDFLSGQQDHEWQLIPTFWVTDAMQRWKESPLTRKRLANEPISIGLRSSALDVAMGGADNCCLAKLYGVWFDALRLWPGTDFKNGGEIARNVVVNLETFKAPLMIDVLATPGGSAVEAFRIQYPNVKVVPINFGMKSDYRSGCGRLGMFNLRAEAYYRLREGLDPDLGPPENRLMLPDSPELMTEICAVRWEPTGGKVKLEPKEDIIARIGRSPDRADAVAMAMLGDRSPNGGWIEQAPVKDTRDEEISRPSRSFMGVDMRQGRTPWG